MLVHDLDLSKGDWRNPLRHEHDCALPSSTYAACGIGYGQTAPAMRCGVSHYELILGWHHSSSGIRTFRNAGHCDGGALLALSHGGLAYCAPCFATLQK